jgi:KaiC/GvpD/RAD55 family RecA-like ATPase
VPLNPTGEIQDFFEFLYGEQTGYVYTPTKHNDVWEKNFFEWPSQRAELISFCLKEAANKDVYCGPALYEKPTGRKEDVKGSYVLWTEFDGSLPPAEAFGDMPSPTRRIRSSEEGHEHFYWRLDYFEVDVDRLERANRGIAYSLGADTSAWDANQVLRPVSTYNHKRGKPVLTLAKSDKQYSVDVFSKVPVPPTVVTDVDEVHLPDALNVVAKYRWESEAFDFFRKVEIPHGRRSHAMMRLAFYCAEMRMSDSEAYAILMNADDRWGKFKGRTDRKRRLLDIINKARLKYPLTVAVAEDTPVFNFQDFLDVDIQVEWVIPGLLQKAGYLLMSGPPGTGKTQLSLRFAINLALGRDFLGYSAGEPLRLLFISMEMGHADLKYFLEQMAETLTAEERELLKANLFIWPLGHGVMLGEKSGQQKVEALIEEYKPDGVFFDSLGMATTDELTEEGVVKQIMDWCARLRKDTGIFAWFLHHNRKAQSTNKKPNKLADVYGSQYITSYATTVLGLWPAGDKIELSALKVRLAKLFPSTYIQRLAGLNFTATNAQVEEVEELETPTGEEAIDLTDDDKPKKKKEKGLFDF